MTVTGVLADMCLSRITNLLADTHAHIACASIHICIVSDEGKTIYTYLYSLSYVKLYVMLLMLV